MITDAIFAEGISGMHRRVSDTAEYGDYSRGKRIVTAQTKKEMKKILGEIKAGKFAKEWMSENATGRKKYNAARKIADNHPIEKVGTELRGMMHWIKNPSGAKRLSKKPGSSKRKAVAVS